MGIIILPEPEPYGDDCLTCYEPGETPQILYAIFKGIAIGDLWGPGLPGPPNRVFQLFQDSPDICNWTYIGDQFDVQYHAVFVGPGLGQTLLNLGIHDPINENVFTGWKENPCGSSFVNERSVPELVPYFGGSGWIFRLTI